MSEPVGDWGKRMIVLLEMAERFEGDGTTGHAEFCRELAAGIERLRERLEEAEKDSERLNRLDAQPFDPSSREICLARLREFSTEPVWGPGTPIREAIDAALEESRRG